MEFGYWAIKGRAQHIRWLIAYTGLDVKEYNPQSMQDWDGRFAEFLKTPNTAFPNLPYFKDGQRFVSETNAVAAAIVVKANRQEMIGNNPADQITHMTLTSVLNDLFTCVTTLGNQSRDELVGSFDKWCKDNLFYVLESFVKILANRPFFLYYVTVADFHFAYIAEVLGSYICEQLKLPNPIERYPTLVQQIKNVRALPGLKEYLNSKDKSLGYFPTKPKFL